MVTYWHGTRHTCQNNFSEQQIAYKSLYITTDKKNLNKRTNNIVWREKAVKSLYRRSTLRQYTQNRLSYLGVGPHTLNRCCSFSFVVSWTTNCQTPQSRQIGKRLRGWTLARHQLTDPLAAGMYYHLTE